MSQTISLLARLVAPAMMMARMLAPLSGRAARTHQRATIISSHIGALRSPRRPYAAAAAAATAASYSASPADRRHAGRTYHFFSCHPRQLPGRTHGAFLMPQLRQCHYPALMSTATKGTDSEACLTSACLRRDGGVGRTLGGQQPNAGARSSSVLRSSIAKEADESTFEQLGLSTALALHLPSLGIDQPTEIQAACIPDILAGDDTPVAFRPLEPCLTLSFPLQRHRGFWTVYTCLNADCAHVDVCCRRQGCPWASRNRERKDGEFKG